MTVVDTSVLMAILRQEDEAGRYLRFMRMPDRDLIMSTATYLEATISAERRLDGEGGALLMRDLCQALLIDVRAFDQLQMSWAFDGYSRFGIGRAQSPAVLNFGDCFSYGLAMAEDAPLLFKGSDFSKTDVQVENLQ
jgi:ribonuclease VapC